MWIVCGLEGYGQARLVYSTNNTQHFEYNRTVVPGVLQETANEREDRLLPPSPLLDRMLQVLRQAQSSGMVKEPLQPLDQFSPLLFRSTAE